MKKAHMFYEVLFLKLGLLRGLYSTMSLQNEGNEVFQKAKERDLAKAIKKKNTTIQRNTIYQQRF